MMNKHEVIQKGGSTLDDHYELYLMKRLDLLSYHSKVFNIRAEQEFTGPSRTTKRFNLVVTNSVGDIIEIKTVHPDDLEFEFDWLKGKYILNYENIL